MRILASMHDDGQFFVLPEQKIFYVSVAKNACTNLKWMLADIAGEDLTDAKAGLASYTDRAHIVHQRSKWKVSPKPAHIDPEVLATIDPGNGWFVFSVIRDPRARCFSAWQDKLLMRNPAYTRWSDRPWYPREPSDPDTIAEDFATFAAALAAEPRYPLLARDVHFRPQVDLLHRDVVDYTRLYDIGELSQLRDDVAAHLERTGWDGELALRASRNDTPLRANRRVFGDEVRAQVESAYAADFAAFGNRWDFARIDNAAEWDADALAATARRAETNDRLGEVRDIAIVRGREIKKLREKVATLEKARTRAATAAERQPARRAVRLARRVARKIVRRGERIRWS